MQAGRAGDEEERENIPPAGTPPSERKVGRMSCRFASLPDQWFIGDLTWFAVGTISNANSCLLKQG